MPKLRPLYGDVLVRIERDKTFGVLALPDLYRDKKAIGCIVAVGPQVRDPNLKIGRFVLIENYNQPIREPVADIMIPGDDIMAVLEEGEVEC